MATVYLALHEMLDREVALKVMAPSLVADPSFGKRFSREAKIVAQLSHQHIISVFDVGVSGHHHYIAMEFHSGGELKNKLTNGLEPKIAISIMEQIASALDFAHRQGYIHRDIKPENILFSREGKSILTDFGIARAELSSTQMTQIGSVIGTPLYMSPEQAQGEKLDGRVDLYSLGVVFYEMLTGNPPYIGDSWVSIAIKHKTEPVPTLPDKFSQYQDFLELAMAKKADDRFQSGQEMINALNILQKGGVVAPVSAKTKMRSPDENTVRGKVADTESDTKVVKIEEKTAGKRKWLLSGVALMVIAGTVAFMMQNPVSDPELPLEPIAEQSNKDDRSAADVPTNIVAKSDKPDALQQKIISLLKNADSAFQDNRLIDPKGNNAQEYYQAALLLDSGNKLANDGLLKMSDRYLLSAEKAIKSNKLSDAQSFIKLATDVYSENANIARLDGSLSNARRALDEKNRMRLQEEKKLIAENQARIAQAEKLLAEEEEERRAIAEKKQKTKIERKRIEKEKRDAEREFSDLLGKAEGYLAPDNLNSSRISRAQNLFEEAKQLSPNDARLKIMLEKIVKGYSILAEEKIADKEFSRADELVLQGLELDPDNEKLISLQETINRSEKEKR
ncbi:MAG: protein kinase, partial [Gammaproteobacteria bacterium]|nr:protein kinase [Gammaproteobacteria bacterium]